jgi:4-amino-4-deoxy-L-arabinose transferase-like glycosyltransferase
MPRRLRHLFDVPVTGDALPWRVFWIAFAVRLLYMTLAHTYRVRPAEGHFAFGWEAGRIARALVTGFGYADPFSNAFVVHTGPTAWLPPAYPLLMAAVFRVFGVYTAGSAWVLLTINCALSAATSLAVWEIALCCFDRQVALWSAWIWALYPAAMQYAVRWLWEMTLTTALFAWVLVLALRMRAACPAGQPRQTGQIGRWAVFGLLWGLIALSNSTLLIFLPVCTVWIVLPAWRRSLPGAALAALIVLACIAPWTLRNWQVFHTFIPMRGNLGAELYMGNGPGSNGLLMEYFHPFQAPDQLRLYAAMGEVRYVAMRGAAAKTYIAAHPGHFLADVGRRIYFFWASVPHPSDDAWYVEFFRVLNFAALSLAGLLGLALALHRKRPAAALFAWAFLLLPIPYYLITVHARFRHPLEPLICILGVYLFQSASPRRPQLSTNR